MKLQIWGLSIVAVLGISWHAVGQDYVRGRGGEQQRRIEQDKDRVKEAYQQGMRQGESDARRDLRPSPRSDRWDGDRAKRAFEAGYDRGYDNAMSEHEKWADRDAYRNGMSAGDRDARNNRRANPRAEQFSRDERDRRAFIAGYNRGYHDVLAIKVGGLEIFLGNIFGSREQDNRRPEGQSNPQIGRSNDRNDQQTRRDGNYQYNQAARGSLTIQGNSVSWQSQGGNVSVFMQEDSKPEKLFASSTSGTQGAPWMTKGHLYVFVLRDQNGNELARSQVDLRR